MTSEEKPAGWSAIRRHLNEQSKLALLALIKDLTTHPPALAIFCMLVNLIKRCRKTSVPFDTSMRILTAW
jgi:hypothetical protein